MEITSLFIPPMFPLFAVFVKLLFFERRFRSPLRALASLPELFFFFFCDGESSTPNSGPCYFPIPDAIFASPHVVNPTRLFFPARLNVP